MGVYSYHEKELKENPYRRNQSDTGEYFNVYASGSGALSFNVSDKGGASLPQSAPVRECLTIWEKFWKGLGWRFGIINHEPCMFEQVERIGLSSLRFKGKDFVYAELPGRSFTHYEFFTKDIAGDLYQVENLSIKAALRFYLENEGQIKENFL